MKDLITSKNKERFEKFILNNIYDEGEYHHNEDALCHFYNLKFEMQWGVFLAYYMSRDMPISIDLFDDEMYYYKIYPNDYLNDNQYDNQKEAWRASLLKANEIENLKITPSNSGETN